MGYRIVFAFTNVQVFHDPMGADERISYQNISKQLIFIRLLKKI